jgi:hypothetical protein
MIGRRDGALMRNNSSDQSLLKSRIAIAIAIGMFLGCIFAFFFPHGLFSSNSPHFDHNHLTRSISQVSFSPQF